MNNTQKGRQALKSWEASKPDNFFTSDSNLQNTLRFYLADDYASAEANWTTLGKHCATIIDDHAKVEDRLHNHPTLQRYNGIGERTESIEFHPNHDINGKLVWQSGVMAIQATPGRTVEQMGLYYLLSQNGEFGHMCSLACTSGLIRALQNVADESVKAKFLPPLLDPKYDTMQHGAQFLTEVQGGSDVGANAVTATDNRDGTWRINGEKWFCSNINADQFLMTARPDNAEDGTRGLGLFLVPRLLDDGTTNAFYIRRLKDKIGTRTLASAELDFNNAVAYPVGAIDRGFKNAVELVLNTSRLMNSVACAGAMRRVYLESAHYACNRTAFGTAIANYPMVQEAIADIMSETYASTSASFYVAHLLDKIETGNASDDDKSVYRLLVNVVKYITSIRGTETIHRGIEVLGGNGAIESFSILPRLYRDMIVLESWEGTHNVLCLQVLRDISKYGIHEPYFAEINRHLDAISHEDLSSNAVFVRQTMAQAQQMLGQLHQGGQAFTQAHARRFVDKLAHLTQATLLLTEAQWELDKQIPTHKVDVATYFINQRLRQDYSPLDDDTYLPRIQRLMMAI